MWNYIKNFFTSFCTESSAHGVKYLMKDKNLVSRCYWCVVLIFSLFCCGYFSNRLSRRFLEIPIRMIIKSNQERTNLLPLPSVTFCSENPAVEWYGRFLDDPNIKLPPGYIREEVLEAMRVGVGSLTLRFVPHQRPLNTTLLHMIDVVLKYNKIKTREFVSRVSVSCDVLLNRCQLRGKVLPCGEVFRRINGQCCRFIDNSKTFVSAGNVFSNNLIVASTTNYGESYIVVHRPLSEPLIDKVSITMSNGYYVMFYITPLTVYKSEEVHEMEEEEGKCVHPDEKDLRFFDEYDYFNCAVELVINASIALCGCAGSYTPAPDQFTCNFTQVNCLRRHPEFNNLGNVAASKGIKLSCPEACTYTDYKVNFKPRILVPEFDMTGFLTGVDNKNQYVVHFTYESQFYKIQEYVLIADWITLLSNLGGVYGLFLGCSMVTLAELMYFLWSTILRKMWNRNVVPELR